MSSENDQSDIVDSDIDVNIEELYCVIECSVRHINRVTKIFHGDKSRLKTFAPDKKATSLLFSAAALGSLTQYSRIVWSSASHNWLTPASAKFGPGCRPTAPAA